MRKRILGILLGFMMIFSLIPNMSAYAGGGEEESGIVDYGVKVCGIGITSLNQNDVLGDGGSVAYMPDSSGNGTLFMADTSLAEIYDDGEIRAAIYTEHGLNIYVVGHCGIDIRWVPEDEIPVLGILCGGDLSIMVEPDAIFDIDIPDLKNRAYAAMAEDISLTGVNGKLAVYVAGDVNDSCAFFETGKSSEILVGSGEIQIANAANPFNRPVQNYDRRLEIWGRKNAADEAGRLSIMEAMGKCAYVEVRPLFPDEAFEEYIMLQSGIDKDENGFLSDEEMTNVKGLWLEGKAAPEVTSLKGIEFFPNLSTLVVSDLALQYTAIERCPNLTKLSLKRDSLEYINLSNNKKLEIIDVQDNKLTWLDVSENSELTVLECSDNMLSELDLSQNKKLETVSSSSCQLTSLILPENNSIKELYLSINSLSELNVNGTKLEKIFCYENFLKELDLSKTSIGESPEHVLEVGSQKYDIVLNLYVSGGEYVSKILADRGTVNDRVIVHNALRITESPKSVTCTEGDKAIFKVAAEGDGLKYQWYWRRNESYAWGVAGFTGAKTASMTVDAIAARNGFQYRCEVKDANNNVVYSEPATLSVEAPKPVQITKQPQNVSGKSGIATFTVTAEGTGLTYQWYWRRNASSAWGAAGFTGSKTASMQVDIISARNGFQYRCEVKDKYGNKVYSNPATLYYAAPLTIVKQPQNVKASGGKVTFSVAAAGEGLTYQWYWRRNSSAEWGMSDLPGNKTATITVEAASARNGFEYRCRVKDKYGNTVISDAGVLIFVAPVKITKQPQNVAAPGGKVVFQVGAVGDGLTYQWYWRRNDASDWGPVSFEGCKTDCVTVDAIAARNGFQYRCLVKDSFGNAVYSNPAVLTFATYAKITKQPVNVKATVGQKAVFTVTAVGDGLTYQWYWRKNGSAEWGPAGYEGSKTPSMTVDAIKARNGFEYRCQVKDKCGNVIISQTATLTVQ